MIKVFSPTDQSFISNGDCVLLPLKAKVHKEDNGDYYLDLVTGFEYADFMVDGNIVVANTPQGDQAFRITNPVKTASKITTKAWHVFYDSKRFLIADSYVVDKDCSEALAHLNNMTMPISQFRTGSDVARIESLRCVRKSLYEAIFEVLERWGGHLVRDNFDIIIRNNIGADHGITVEYRKNLREITCEENWDDVVTQLLPVGKDGIMLNSMDASASIYMTSNVQYSIPYTKTVDFQQDINKEDYSSDDAYKLALIADLRSQAQSYLNTNQYPKVNYTLKASLDRIVDIGDTIEVKDRRLNIDLLTQVISYDYDCILEKYTEIEFGNFKKKLSNLISNVTASATSSAVMSATEAVDASIEVVNQTISQMDEDITQVDQKLILTNSTEIEAGYSSTYDTFNVNVVNSDGDAISLNNMGTGKHPALTYLPDNDWTQAQNIGNLAFQSDVPTKTSELTNDSGFLTSPSLQTATVAGAYSGSCSYLKLGRMVIFDANISTSGALSNGTILASGLPANHVVATMAYGFNNNSSTENVAVYITSSGTLTVRGAFASANRVIRVSGAYISAS